MDVDAISIGTRPRSCDVKVSDVNPVTVYYQNMCLWAVYELQTAHCKVIALHKFYCLNEHKTTSVTVLSSIFLLASSKYNLL